MAANSYLDSINQARQFVQEHYKDWENIDRKILDISKNAQKIVVSDVDGSLKELNARIQQNSEFRKQMNQQVREQEKLIKSLRAELEKMNKTRDAGKKAMTDEERLNRKVENSYKALNDTLSDENKIIEQNRAAAAKKRKEDRDDAKAILALDSAYGAASQKLKAITKEYSNLAIRKELNNDLTEEEIKRMNVLEGEIDQLRGSLVKVDQRVGNFGRSVGSYGKSFDSLGFSIAQVTREFPAFAYGAQIGFAALSNNIPILVDEINKVIATNKMLQAEGKATQSVMKTLASSIFGFQTMISLGVTLLTLYGSEMIEVTRDFIDFRSEAEKSEDKLKDLNEALEEFIEGMDDLSKVRLEGAKSAREESLRLELLNDRLTDANASNKERKDVIEELRKLYPDYLKDMEDDELLANGLGDAYDELSKSLLATARSRAAFDKILKNQSKQLELEAQLASKRIELSEATDRLTKAQKIYDENRAANVPDYGDRSLQNSKDAVVELQEEIQYLVGTQQGLELSNINLMGSVTDLELATENNTEATKKNVREQLEYANTLERLKHFAGSVDYYQALISRLDEERKKVATNSTAWKLYTMAIEGYQKAIKDIEGGPELMPAIDLEQVESDADEAVEVWKEAADEIIDAAGEIGSNIMQGEVDRVQQQIEANKTYYAELLDNAELTEERRAALEAERDNKERKLMKEKRKRQWEQFMFERSIALAIAAIKVGEAITEFGVITPQAIIAGLAGAAIIAEMVATPIPKFEKGTENAPQGWAIVDEVRPEVHTDKHGNVKSFGSDKGSNLRFLDAGDKIYRSHEDYMKKQGLEGIEDNVWNLNMKYQGRPVPQSDSNLALLSEISMLRSENSKVWREVKKLASRPINNNLKIEYPDNRPY